MIERITDRRIYRMLDRKDDIQRMNNITNDRTTDRKNNQKNRYKE